MSIFSKGLEAGESFKHLAERLLDWWTSGPGRGELERLGAGEIERMAQDLGLSPGDLTRLAARDAQASLLLHRRLSLLGLSSEDIERLGFRHDLERTCGLCGDQRVCEHDLEMRPDGDEWKRYCPNVASLERIAAEVRRRD